MYPIQYNFFLYIQMINESQTKLKYLSALAKSLHSSFIQFLPYRTVLSHHILRNLTVSQLTLTDRNKHTKILTSTLNNYPTLIHRHIHTHLGTIIHTLTNIQTLQYLQNSHSADTNSHTKTELPH